MEPFPITTNNDTIAAIATPAGMGGLAIIRVSGPEAVNIVNSAWKGADLKKVASHTVHLGKYFSIDGNLLDEAIVSIYLTPASFTGEDVVEISLHGSKWIQREVLSDLIKRGTRIALPGEFSQRAFINGKIDLSQAEGIADLIAASSKASHDLAIRQTKGSFSKELESLREKLIEFASLMELELDFSEEDVEFADRSRLLDLCKNIKLKIDRLASSYSSGAVLKDGISVAIAGIPNAGKSSLLNLLLGDERAIVTDIPGTTRDTIEDTVEIDGILYRFIDTAGLRSTSDIVENKGIERARQSIEKAYIVIWVLDPTSKDTNQYSELNSYLNERHTGKLILLLNKSDLLSKPGSSGLDHQGNKNRSDFFRGGTDLVKNSDFPDFYGLFGFAIPFSTVTGEGLKELKDKLNELATDNLDLENDLIVTNARHYEGLVKASESLQRVEEGLDSGLSGDFISQDIRETIHHLSLITGEITTDNLLHSIFSRFCIGK